MAARPVRREKQAGGGEEGRPGTGGGGGGGVRPLRRRGMLKAEERGGGGGVKLLDAAGAEAGRWATGDLFRQAGNWHGRLSFFSPLHCIQGKKGAEWSFSLNADPGANDQHEMVVEVFFLHHGVPFGLDCAVSVLAPFFQ